MKKILFALPLAALGLILTFCNKPNLQDTGLSSSPAIPASDRADGCQLEIYADNSNTLQVCGLAINFQTCKGCPGSTVYNGLDFVNDYAIFSVPSSITFAITNLGSTSTDIRLFTPVDMSPVVTLGPGECEVFTLDADCNF